MAYELYIENGGTRYVPLVKEGIQWTTERVGAPAKLKFSVLGGAALDITEGNTVMFTVDGFNVFYGFVFSQKRDRENVIEITAYDQTRYLKNKDTYVYSDKTASDVIRMIAADFKLNTGDIENTGFTIASRVEDNTELFDVIYNALDLELTNRGNMYVLYDDFGRLTLKSLVNMRVGILIDADTGENYDYTSSIDEATYNRIKLSYDNQNSGKREVYIAQDGQRINDWGVLQYYDTLKEGENGGAKADALLKLYNTKTRKLKITNAFGDVRVRAGSMPVVDLDLGDMRFSNYMLVEKAVHTFNESDHRMELNLRGGEFVG